MAGRVEVETDDGMILQGYANVEMTIDQRYDRRTLEVIGWEMVLRGSGALTQSVRRSPGGLDASSDELAILR